MEHSVLGLHFTLGKGIGVQTSLELGTAFREGPRED